MRRAPGIESFKTRNLPASAWFPHDVFWIAKPYPDTMLQLAHRGVPRSVVDGGRAVQINLYSDVLEDLPDAVFSDRAVNWHQQQLGRKGLVAAAGLFLEPRGLFVTLLQSDLCQQIFRHPTLKAACKTRLDNRVGSWPSMLVNAVLDYATTHAVSRVYFPTSAQILSGIRQAVDPTLFRRIYDDPLQRYLCELVTLDDASYREVDLPLNHDRVVPLAGVENGAGHAPGKTIVLFHDIEEDVAVPVDPERCRSSLRRMLEVEARRGLRLTYNVVGTLFRERAARIAAGGHSLGFHSFDHVLDAPAQLRRVRNVDLQVRGYRPPQSVLTEELSEYNLAYFNFDWLLSSAWRFGFADCRLENGIAKIPVHLDDYVLHDGQLDFAAWRARIRRLVSERDVVAIGLHDCYAPHWLDEYDELLDELGSLGEIVTCDALADRLFLDSDSMPLRRDWPQVGCGTSRVG
jgi:hypothetical protein